MKDFNPGLLIARFGGGRRTLATAGFLLLLAAAPLALWAQQASSWSTPVNLGATINTADTEGCPCISMDELSLYFVSNRPGGQGMLDLYVAQRATVNDAWGAPQNLGDTINSSSNEQCPTLTAEGNTLYFVSDRPGGCGGIDLYVARRRADGSWAPPVNLGCQVNSPANDLTPSLFDDGVGNITLYFHSNRPGGRGGADIYSSALRADGTFGPAMPVTELNTEMNDTRPNIRPDGLEIFFDSNRTGSIAGSVDIWVATRSYASGPWSTPVNLGPGVNSDAAEERAYVTFNGRMLYFMSNRPGGAGAFDIYTTTRAAGAPLVNVSAASFRGPSLAVESIAAAFGSDLSGATLAATSRPLPTTLGDVSLRVRDSAGVERLAPLFSVGPTQINFQIPSGISTGAATLTLLKDGASVSASAAPITSVAPGIFTANSNGEGVPAGFIVRVKPDNTQTIEPIATFNAAQRRFAPTPIDLGSESEQVILVLFGTGWRYRSSLQSTSVKIGGMDGQTLYAGAQGDLVGLDQFNVRLPRSLVGRGEVEVTLMVDGRAANPVRISIK